MSNQLHHHPITECRENIPSDKVLVDKEFSHLFDKYETYWDGHHIIVDKQEFVNVKIKLSIWQ